MFQFLDHPSEAYVEVSAHTLTEVFQDAAIALFEIMTDTTVLRPEISFDIDVEAQDRSLLLIDWLNRLILLHEVEKVFLCRFDVEIRPWKLHALVSGERIRENQERRSQAKSATFGQLEWSEEPFGLRVKFVVDI
jgi:SHS2 domain-containing protein